LSEGDVEIVERVKIAPYESAEDPSPTLTKWKEFDIAFRNEMARSRAAKRSVEAAEYIRGEDYNDPFISGFTQWASSQDSPIEAELSIDRLKWEKIEELEKGHYFDIDSLITYALKLQILERWERINSGGGMEILQRLVERKRA